MTLDVAAIRHLLTEARDELLALGACTVPKRIENALNSTVFTSSPTPDGVIKERGEDGRDPSGQAAQQSPSPSVSALTGEHPSRITIEGIEHLLWELSRDQDTEFEDTQVFRQAWSRLQQYRPEARRIIFASAGHWSAWSEEELDSDPSDPLVGRTIEWFVGFWRTGEPEADTYVRTGSGRSAERIAREIAADLNEMVSLADRARDQRAEREDAQRPRPEAASPVRNAEAPASTVQPPSSQESGIGETEGQRIRRGASLIADHLARLQYPALPLTGNVTVALPVDDAAALASLAALGSLDEVAGHDAGLRDPKAEPWPDEPWESLSYYRQHDVKRWYQNRDPQCRSSEGEPAERVIRQKARAR